MIASLRNVTYHFPGREHSALAAVNLDIGEGDFCVVAGPSGGGKSTLLRTLNGLVPQFSGGEMAGEISVAGRDPRRAAPREMARIAGFVFQEPEAQAVAETVEDEIAFGMEQHGLPRPEMERRLAAILDRLGIARLRTREVATLSGGERQRVAIAAVLALQPRLLLLDEPTSQLDPEAADAVLHSIHDIHATSEATVLLAEHRLDRLLPLAESLVTVIAGRVAAGSVPEMAYRLPSPPVPIRLAQQLGLESAPLTVEDLQAQLTARPTPVTVTPRPIPTPGDTLLDVRGLSVELGGNQILDAVDLTLREGEVVALIGANGSGKTTLFRSITGQLQPSAGAITFRGAPAPPRVQDRSAFAGLAPQDPSMALYCESVADEVTETLRLRRRPSTAAVRDALLERWNVRDLAARNPRDISVGQQLRVALAAMLAHDPPVWLMDEPTRGADGDARRWLARTIREHAGHGGAAIVSTHDIAVAATFASRVVALDGGRVIFDLPVRDALGHAGPRPTQTARAIPGAISPEEVRRAN